MKLNLKTAVAGAAIAATAVLAASGTAAADYNACQAGKVCLFDGHDGTGDVLQLDGVDNPNVGQAWNDRAGSLWNRTDKNVCVWTDANYRGLNWIIEPGQKQELLFLYDNAVTSIEVHYGYGCGG
ncbi:hypothetical protein GCM10023084_64490 [Streptomyces lacrimifluminis]|uniref:Peptidase inhibitor family I36 n=1 Tax=Streptomyces lacrimifluminis TaxID=1500077 RepID=A0A917LBT8_9ACTN|nr:peptidase inhibitor family I36 protein [Streptomyces lacrimifluminis]GGJ58493.1 hypothetical protein GCM10012282_64860 [Streptomyces lacrimifluminis]